jgi:hypothetical protein
MQRAAGAELEGGEALAQGAEEGIATERAEFNRAECSRAPSKGPAPGAPPTRLATRGPAEISRLVGPCAGPGPGRPTVARTAISFLGAQFQAPSGVGLCPLTKLLDLEMRQSRFKPEFVPRESGTCLHMARALLQWATGPTSSTCALDRQLAFWNPAFSMH